MLLVFLISFFGAESRLIAAELPSPQVAPVEIERSRKRLYAGGRDEEDLKVMATLPETSARTSLRMIQKEVHKKLFDEELKDDDSEMTEVGQ